MTVTYHSGERIQATQADFDGIPAISGGWKEVARTTLGSTTKPITVSSIADKRYYMILVDMVKSGNATSQMRYGNSTIDTGTNYSDRGSYNGAGDGTRTSVSTHEFATANAGVADFMVGYIANLAGKEKLMQYQWMYNSATGAPTAPQRAEKVGKWTNTSNPIDIMELYNSQSGNYVAGSEMVVLGWDEDDTHTTNFWEELASVDLSGGAATNIDSGTISTKKYLWLQFYTQQSVDSNYYITFNSDDASGNYAVRYSRDGASDSTLTSRDNFYNVSYSANIPQFTNMFIVNNSSNEKLITGQTVYRMTAGASTAPNRMEIVGKWANTSEQIDEINIKSGTGNLASNSFLKVWGSN